MAKKQPASTETGAGPAQDLRGLVDGVTYYPRLGRAHVFFSRHPGDLDPIPSLALALDDRVKEIRVYVGQKHHTEFVRRADGGWDSVESTEAI